MSDSCTDGALAGVKVVDLSRVLAGPYCTQMLADHGAEVIKVEPPAGDDTRRWGPPFVAEGMSAYYQGLNRNKQHVCIDLASEQGQAVLARLLADADVLVENFKVGTLARWGFTDERLQREFPRLIHCRITGFGVDGPRGGAPGYDAVLQAFSGLMAVNGEEQGGPLRIGVPVVDMVTGIHAFSGVLLALYERMRSGVGQRVDCSLLDTSIGLLHPHSANWLADGREPVRTGSAHPNIAPYDVFTAKDGDIFITVGNDRQFQDFARAIGAEEQLGSPEFASNAERVANRRKLKALILPVTLEMTRAELVERLSRVGVPAMPVNAIGEALTDEQVRHRELVLQREGYRGIGFPVRLNRTPASLRQLPGSVGRDSLATLQTLGYTAADVEAMMQAVVVR